MISRTKSCCRKSLLARSFITVVTCLLSLMPLTLLAQSAGKSALRQLVERFYAAYAAKDLNSLLLLHSNKSPNLAIARRGLEQVFAANKLELKSLSIEKITVEGDRGAVRLIVDWNAVDIKTGAPANGFAKPLKRTLACVKEGGAWKVWESRSPEMDLAYALVAAKKDERKALLESDKDLLNISLVRAVLEQAFRFYDQSNFSRAVEVFEYVVDMATQVGDRRGHTAALRGIGAVQGDLGNYKEALDYYETSVRLAEEVNDRSEVALGLNCIGTVHDAQGNFSRALEYYERALKIRQDMGDKAWTADILGNIGGIYRLQGNHARALEYFHNSLRISEERNDKPKIAASLRGIGNVYNAEGNRVRALEYLQRSLKIAEEIDEKRSVALVLSHIGQVHEQQGNLTQALAYFEKGLKIAEETGSKPLFVRAMYSLGNVQHVLGNFSQALEYYEKGLRIAEEIGDSFFIAANLFDIGILHSLQGRSALALEYYQRSLRILEQMGNKEGVSTTLAAIGFLHLDRGENSQAVDLAARAHAIAAQIGSREVLAEVNVVAGKAHRGLNQPEKARQEFADAIDEIEELRTGVAGGIEQEQRFFERMTSPYYEMVDLLISQQKITESLEYAERAKGRALLDSLKSGRVNITRAMTVNEQEEERKLNGEVNSLNIQITIEKVRKQPDQTRLTELNVLLTRARLNQERFQINLYAAHPELKVQRGQMRPITLDQAGRLILDTDTALLEYVVAKDKTQLFVLTRRSEVKGEQTPATPSLKVYTLNIKLSDLADRVEKFRGRLANQDFLFHEPARELYDLLVGPARAELQNKTNLIIVPDKILWELPFQALQPAPKRFLIENSAVSYAPSLTVLLEMTRARSSAAINSPKLLALGNPAIGKQATKRMTSGLMDERLDPLPEAERQVNELAKLYGPERSRIYIGPEAQEARVKTEAHGYGILHLAAHGILNDKNPMYSQVVLSQPEGDTNEDGMLEAWEIMKLDLKADLVVLSACETARGKVGNGEGMIGLAWAFFVAGVPTTVASQWSVEAASTTELMVEFHRNLERHKGKAESLRQAMLKLLKRKEYNRPFYWAGFVVVGNGR